jgi:hypothetical protein
MVNILKRVAIVTLKCHVHILGSNDVVDHCNIIVVGGFAVHRNVLGTYYNITIRQSKGHGVRAYSSSFTLNGIIIEQCDCSGVVAYASSTLARCANILVRRQCGESGMGAGKGGSIILEGM